MASSSEASSDKRTANVSSVPNRKTVRSVFLPKDSTRSSIVQAIAGQLWGDTSTNIVKTREEREKSLLRARNMAAEIHKLDGKRYSDRSRRPRTGGNIRIRENVGPLGQPPPISQKRREELSKLTIDLKQSDAAMLDPYTFEAREARMIAEAAVYESMLPLVQGNVLVEMLHPAFNDLKSCHLKDVKMLWDTGAHYPVITDDMLPPKLLKQLREQYAACYKCNQPIEDSKMFVQLNMDIRFSNKVETIDCIACVRPAGSLPNYFSGIILGQHSFLNQLDFHMVPRQVLRAGGEKLKPDLWGEIVLDGRVIDEKYIKLGR